MYSYTTFALKSICVRTQTLISACFGIEYKPPYIAPYFYLLTPSPFRRSDGGGLLSSKFFFEIFIFHLLVSLISWI